MFIRDPDRTVVELENNVADDENVNPAEVFPQAIGHPRGVDHVGIRVSNPEASWQWYATKLGFIRSVMRYNPSPEPLKNFQPFISRTNTGIDINFIINANKRVDGKNILTSDTITRPGIVYVAFEVASVSDAEARLRDSGIEIKHDQDMSSGEWGLIEGDFELIDGRPSLFLRDDDLNLIRLVESE